jgi:hypothetical protein
MRTEHGTENKMARDGTDGGTVNGERDAEDCVPYDSGTRTHDNVTPTTSRTGKFHIDTLRVL